MFALAMTMGLSPRPHAVGATAAEPTTAIVPCWAHVGGGHATVAPPESVLNSRHFIALTPKRQSYRAVRVANG